MASGENRELLLLVRNPCRPRQRLIDLLACRLVGVGALHEYKGHIDKKVKKNQEKSLSFCDG